MKTTVTIKGNTFTEYEDGVDEILWDGETPWVFAVDYNHTGGFAVTQKVMDDYGLNSNDEFIPIEEWFEGDDESIQDLKDGGYSHYIAFGHFAGVVDSNTGEWVYEFETPTPWGATYSEEFVANYCGFPEGLFEMNEDEGVNHLGFCDG